MTALSANKGRESRNLGAIMRYKMKASVTIYAGSIVMLNSDGLALVAAASASNQGCVGVATEKVTSAASGDYYIHVQEGDYKFAATSIADTDIGIIAYAVDDNTIDETDTGNLPKAGYLTEVESSTLGWVRMDLACTR